MIPSPADNARDALRERRGDDLPHEYVEDVVANGSSRWHDVGAARERRAFALLNSGWVETPESEREVPLIRALTALDAEEAGTVPPADGFADELFTQYVLARFWGAIEGR